MDDPLYVLVVLAMSSVAIVLAIGLGGFVAGGEFNRKYGNKLMRLRIILQFIAVGLILLYFFLRNLGG
jgi:Hypoxia induced protein conserved region